MAQGRFRLDLYYRQSVFPINLSSLRERKEDIPVLASFFANTFVRKMGKRFPVISSPAHTERLHYHWQSNIRELENLIEQAVIRNDGQSPLELGRPLVNATFAPVTSEMMPAAPIRKLEEMRNNQPAKERAYLLSVLKQTNGRIRDKAVPQNY